MGKRIRHLEFYGYADQNVYMGIPNVDLSDIRETNKEQDKEINAISGATSGKADKTTVDSLSGKVDTFMDKQDRINKWLAKGINKNRERIDKLEQRDIEITDKINEIVDDFNPIYDELDNLSTKIDLVDERLTQHISQESTFEEETDARLDSLESKIDDKIDKSEAENIFAKKDDVYTKQEVDDLIEGIGDDYATEEWVMSRGFITETDADGKYATKSRLNALEDRVGDIQTTTYEIGSDLSQFKTSTNNKIDDLDTRLDTLEIKHDRDISDLQSEDDELREDIDRNSNDIYQINNVALPNKANRSDLDSLSSRVDSVSIALNNKVDKADYARDQSLIEVKLNDIRDKKADKTQISGITEEINNLSSDLEQEIRDRIAGDNALSSRIDDANERINDIREENVERDRKINNLQSGLTNEINDRIEADNAIIGSPSDREEDNTIYGAKKYAKNVANNALNEAKAYTDIKDSSVRDYVDETKVDLERQITAKADKAYVNAVKAEIETSVEEKIAEEKDRAQSVESGLASAIRQETIRAIGKENTISTALTHTSNIVKALTDWDGDDRADYTDVGNGIVDVMHREIHNLNISTSTELFANAEYHEYDKKIHFYAKDGNEICSIDTSNFAPSVITDIWYDETTKELVIVWDSGSGSAETRIPLSDIFNPDNYYTKEETDNLLNEKLDVSAYTDVSEQVIENKNNIETLSGSVQSMNSGLDALINRLGYTDNDTLVKNGEREVAFGQYNISNTSEDPSGTTIFSIGNGTDNENRSNAFEVRQNGDVYLWVEGEFMNINKMLGQIAHEIY